MTNIKSKLYQIFESREQRTALGTTVNTIIILLIIFNLLSVIVETVSSIYNRYQHFFTIFEIISVFAFTVEYTIRLWVCTNNNRYEAPIRGRLRYATTPLAIIDLLAILPFYLAVIAPFDLRFLRAVRLFRLFRVMKIARYSESVQKLGTTLRKKAPDLMVVLSVVLLLLIIASSLMYLVENKAQPEAFSSIPAAMWWGIATLTTVGYGDVYPITPLGKFFGSIIAVLGIGMVALPAGILGSGYIEELYKKKNKKCPHCGKSIE
jgi:voltage-gated potassium channel